MSMTVANELVHTLTLSYLFFPSDITQSLSPTHSFIALSAITALSPPHAFAELRSSSLSIQKGGFSDNPNAKNIVVHIYNEPVLIYSSPNPFCSPAIPICSHPSSV